MGVQIAPCKGAIFTGKDVPGRHSAMSCAKVAEPIQMSFRWWTRVGPRKHVLHEVGAHWRHLANTIELSMCGGDADLLSYYFGQLFCTFSDLVRAEKKTAPNRVHTTAMTHCNYHCRLTQPQILTQTLTFQCTGNSHLVHSVPITQIM